MRRLYFSQSIASSTLHRTKRDLLSYDVRLANDCLLLAFRKKIVDLQQRIKATSKKLYDVVKIHGA